MVLIGHFNPKVDDLALYEEQLKQFFDIKYINDISASEKIPTTKKRVTALLSSTGQDTY